GKPAQTLAPIIGTKQAGSTCINGIAPRNIISTLHLLSLLLRAKWIRAQDNCSLFVHMNTSTFAVAPLCGATYIKLIILSSAVVTLGIPFGGVGVWLFLIWFCVDLFMNMEMQMSRFFIAAYK